MLDRLEKLLTHSASEELIYEFIDVERHKIYTDLANLYSLKLYAWCGVPAMNEVIEENKKQFAASNWDFDYSQVRCNSIQAIKDVFEEQGFDFESEIDFAEMIRDVARQHEYNTKIDPSDWK